MNQGRRILSGVAVLLALTCACLTSAAAARTDIGQEREAFARLCARFEGAPERAALVPDLDRFARRSKNNGLRARAAYLAALCLGDTPAAQSRLRALARRSGDDALGLSAGFDQGRILYNRGSMRGAARYFNQFLARYPSSFISGEALYALSQAQLGLSDWLSADTTVRRLVAEHPAYARDERVITTQGLLLYEQEKPGEASVLFSRLITPCALYYNGRSLMSERRYVKAIVEFRRLAERFPGSEYEEAARFFSADCFLQAADYATAIAEFDDFLLRYPTSTLRVPALYEKACCHYRAGEYGSAAAAFRAIADDPVADGDHASDARMMQGQSLLKQGALTEAMAVFGVLTSTRQNDERRAADALFYSGWCYTLLGNTERAVEMFDQLCAHYPSYDHAAEAIYLTAENRRRSRDPEAAVAGFRKVLDHPVRSAQLADTALFMAIRTLFDQGRYQDIVNNYYFLLRQLPPGGSEQRALGFILVGEAYYYLGMFDESLKVYSSVGSAWPYTRAAALAQDGKAWIHFRRKDFDQARIERQSLMENQTVHLSSSTRAQSEFDMGMILFSQQRYEEADGYFRRFAARYPGHELAPEALFSAGRCDYRLERYAAAIATWSRLAEEFPRSPLAAEARSLAADTYFRAGKYKNAYEGYQVLVRDLGGAPLGRQAQLRAGQSLYNRGDDRGAVREFSAFIAAYPDDPQAQSALEGVMMAAYRISQSRPQADEDIAILRALLERQPRSALAPAIQYRMAERLYEKNDFTRSATEFRRVVQNFPESQQAGPAAYYAAEALYGARLYAEAVPAYQMFLQSYPASEFAPYAALHNAACLFHRELYKEAGDAYLAAASRTGIPEDAGTTALLNASLSYRKARMWNEAVLAYKRFAEQYPASASLQSSRLELAQTYAQMDQNDAAAETFRGVITALPAGDPVRCEASGRLADLLLKQGKSDEAVAELERLAAAGPRDNRWRLNGLAALAQEYENRALWDRASAVYREIMSSTKDRAWVSAARQRAQAIKGSRDGLYEYGRAGRIGTGFEAGQSTGAALARPPANRAVKKTAVKKHPKTSSAVRRTKKRPRQAVSGGAQ